MKSRPSFFFCHILLPAALVLFSGSALALTKLNNATALNAAGSWNEGTAPLGTDVLLFDSIISGPLTVAVGASATVGGSLQFTSIGGNVAITQSSGHTWTLGNGGIDMSAATADVTIGASGRTLRWANANYGGMSVASGRTLTINSNFSNQGNTKAIAMTGSGNIIFNGSAGSGGATSFNVNGATVTMNNASNGWTSGTITAGSLVIGNTTALQNQTVTNNAAAGIKFGTGITSATLGNLAGTGSIDLVNANTNAVTLTVGGNNSSQTYSGALSGNGSLIKSGTGTLTLNGSSSAYTSGVALNNGTLSIGNSNGAGTSASTVTAVTGTTILANSSLGANTVAAAITLSGTNANVILTNANASGGFSSTFSGSADQTLTISQAGGQNVNLNTTNKQLQNFNGTVAIASGQNLAFRATSLNNGSDNALFEVNGGLSTRNNGNLALGALSGSGTVGMGSNGGNGLQLTYTIGARNTNTTFSGTIQEADAVNGKIVNVIKTGTGIQTLSGANTYTGKTTITGGTLALTGAGSLASPNIIVGASTTFDVSAVTGGFTLASGQTLSGPGTVSGAMTVTGTLNPGSSPGTMTTGSQVWLDGGDYNWQILDATGIGGTGYDTIAITGTLDLSALTADGFGLNLWSLSSISPDVSGNAVNFNNLLTQSWTILTTTGGITGFDAADFLISVGANNGAAGFSNTLDGGGSFSLGQTGNNLVLTYAVVPEPNAAMLVGGLGMFVFLRRRRA